MKKIQKKYYRTILYIGVSKCVPKNNVKNLPAAGTEGVFIWRPSLHEFLVPPLVRHLENFIIINSYCMNIFEIGYMVVVMSQY